MYKYTAADVDWMGVYDKTTNACYFLPSELLGEGKAALSLRLTPSKNGQTKGVRWAKDYVTW